MITYFLVTNNCETCYGRGTIICGTCSGRGYHQKHTMNPFDFKTYPRITCSNCGGGGVIQCPACRGLGKKRETVVVDLIGENKFCTNCGNKFSPSDKYCSNCGTKK